MDFKEPGVWFCLRPSQAHTHEPELGWGLLLIELIRPGHCWTQDSVHRFHPAAPRDIWAFCTWREGHCHQPGIMGRPGLSGWGHETAAVLSTVQTVSWNVPDVCWMLPIIWDRKMGAVAVLQRRLPKAHTTTKVVHIAACDLSPTPTDSMGWCTWLAWLISADSASIALAGYANALLQPWVWRWQRRIKSPCWKGWVWTEFQILPTMGGFTNIQLTRQAILVLQSSVTSYDDEHFNRYDDEDFNVTTTRMPVTATWNTSYHDDIIYIYIYIASQADFEAETHQIGLKPWIALRFAGFAAFPFFPASSPSPFPLGSFSSEPKPSYGAYIKLLCIYYIRHGF